MPLTKDRLRRHSGTSFVGIKKCRGTVGAVPVAHLWLIFDPASMTIRNLNVKVVVPVVVGIAVSTLVATVVQTYCMRQALDEITMVRARNLSSTIRHDIARSMQSGDRTNLDGIFDNSSHSPDIAAARVLTTDGLVRHSTNPAEVGRLMQDHVRQTSPLGDRTTVNLGNGRTIAVAHTVSRIAKRDECAPCHKNSASTLALLDLDLDLTRQQAGFGAIRRLSAASAVWQAGVAVALIIPTLWFLIVTPIRRLVRAMDRVKTGDLHVDVPTAGTTEVDALIEGFNTMVHQLQVAAHRDEEVRLAHMERVEQLAVVGELAAGLAHEIRNPLSGVRAALEVMAEELPASDSHRSILEESAAQLTFIDRVTHDLLQYARPRAPSFTLVSLSAIIDEVVTLIQSKASTEGIALRTQTADRAFVEVDELMIRQVILNLALNAIRAVETVGQDGRVAIAIRRSAGHVTCRVTDNGPGVPAGQAEAIFQPFFTTRPGGTGLGLAISRRLIELHDGRLWLENPGEPGASFAFALPVATQSS